MQELSSISDSELLASMPALVLRERVAMVEVIEHLVELERRRLYLEQACSSLYSYCLERLDYSEDAAMKRVRVARLALRLPAVLEELRSGALHLTGLFLLSEYLTDENQTELLAEARGQSRREIEKLIARWFPRPDVKPRISPVPGQPSLPALGAGAASGPRPAFTCPEPGNFSARPRIEPLSESSYRVEFTASAELYAKLEQALELLSHAVPSANLPEIFERGLDADREGAPAPARRRPAAKAPRAQAGLAARTRRGRGRGAGTRRWTVHLCRRRRPSLQRAALYYARAQAPLCSRGTADC